MRDMCHIWNDMYERLTERRRNLVRYYVREINTYFYIGANLVMQLMMYSHQIKVIENA